MARSKKAPKEKKAKKAAPARRQAAEAVVEIEEVKAGGMGIDEGIILTTTIAMGGALFLMWQAVQTYTA